MKPTVICFGEVLWDVFPTHEKIGGAPLNVALRLNSFNIPTAIASQVGKDVLGDRLLSFIEKQSLTTSLIQKIATFPTGEVKVFLDNEGGASYEIFHPAAWDKIEIDQRVISKVQTSPFFLFGSLITRDTVSKESLMTLLAKAQFKIFDLNLRPPYYDYALLMDLMTKADLIKFNEEELLEISAHFEGPKGGVKEALLFISKKTNTQQLVVTLGAKGALCYYKGEWLTQKGFLVEVADTVGAGDSFLATFVEGLVSQRPLRESLQRACAMGALVASKEGANPSVTEKELLTFISSAL